MLMHESEFSRQLQRACLEADGVFISCQHVLSYAETQAVPETSSHCSGSVDA